MRLSFLNLLKTKGDKMSVFRLSTILMKRNELNLSLHDVDEKNGVIDNAGEEEATSILSWMNWPSRF
jgi:hypothetical protein